MALRMPGDRKIIDRTPTTSNIGGRLVKNMCICGSGIYKYHRSEAGLFGLDSSFLPGDQEYFGMYRPPEVLQRNKDCFARVPIITGRHVLVDTGNAKQLTVGLVGDTIDAEYNDSDGELYLYTTGTIVAGDGVSAYEQWGQLSVGYSPVCEWRHGTHNNMVYDAILLDFKDVNHLLICQEARGGPQCMIMDSLDNPNDNHTKETKKVSILTMLQGLMKPAKTAGDARVPILLNSIAAGADPARQVAAIKAIVGSDTRIAGDTKTALDECLNLLAGCKADTDADKQGAIAIVQNLYQQAIGGDEFPPKKEEPGDAGICDKCKKPTKECSCSKDAAPPSGGDARYDALSKDVAALTSSVKELTAAMAAQIAAGTQVPGDATPPAIALQPTLPAAPAKVTSDSWLKGVLQQERAAKLLGGE